MKTSLSQFYVLLVLVTGLSACTNCPPSKPVIGSSETISVPAGGETLQLPAKTDTGAATSSIHATDVTRFKKNGKEYVRFITGHDDKKGTVEAPFSREGRVTSSNGTSAKRVFVELSLTLGQHSFNAEFSLAERGSMNNPVLLGKSLLKDRFVVDVSRDGALTNVNPKLPPKADESGNPPLPASH